MRIDPRLPGADLIEQGLADLANREMTADALLVLVARQLLIDGGIAVPPDPEREAGEVELRLYAALARGHGDDAYSQYNSRLRRLQSFVKSLGATRGGAFGAGPTRSG